MGAFGAGFSGFSGAAVFSFAPAPPAAPSADFSPGLPLPALALLAAVAGGVFFAPNPTGGAAGLISRIHALSPSSFSLAGMPVKRRSRKKAGEVDLAGLDFQILSMRFTRGKRSLE